MPRMQRTQIYIEPALNEALDRLARQRSTSRADLIRLAAREYVERKEAGYGSILELAGIGDDDATDVAKRHDDYLAQHELDGWRQ